MCIQVIKPKSMYSLKGIFKGKPYEDISRDIKSLQKLQTKILRLDGTGFIYRM